MKPRLQIAPRAPRKQVDESVAQKLEEALERKSEGIAGGAQGFLEVTPAEAEVAEDNPPPPRSRKSDIAVKGKAKSASSPLPAAANTGLGTRANPRERKTDGIKTRSTSIHIPIDLGLKLTMYCARNGRRQSEIVALAVEEWLSVYDAK